MRSYQQLLTRVLELGEPHADRTGVGTTSLFGEQWRHDMRSGFPLLTVKRVPMRWVAVELEWFLRGQSDAGWLKERGVDIWDEWATAEKCAVYGREAGDLGPVYGPMWRDYPCDGVVSVDQVDTLLRDLERSPESRRLIVNSWHPLYSKAVTLPPCHVLFQLKVHQSVLSADGREGLSLSMYARSIDAFLGLPFDVASYGLLLELLAQRTGKEARWLVVSFGDLHVYDSHREQVATALSREPRQLPRLTVGSVSDDLREFTYRLDGYDPHPKIEAEVAV
jgi:thymidylate synthase